MSRDTVCRSMYSDISKRIKLQPQLHGKLAGHFGFADPRGTGQQERPDRLLAWHSVRARASLMEVARLLDGAVLAEHTICRFCSSFFNVLSSELTVLGGMRAILAMTVSMSPTPMTFLRLDGATQLLEGARLVDHVNGLVRQKAVGDIASRQIGGDAQRLVGVP